MSNCCGALARFFARSSDSTMYFTTAHDSAVSFLAHAGPALRQHEAVTNIVLAHAEEAANFSGSSQAAFGQCCASTTRPDLWLCSWTKIHTSGSGRARSSQQLDIVIACASSYMGPLPLFIVFLGDNQELVPEFIQPRISDMAEQIAGKMEPSVISSIFGPSLLVQMFANEWQRITGAAVTPGGPWYEARLLECNTAVFDENKSTITPLQDPETTHFRLASLVDLPAVSELCRLYSLTSHPYELSESRAEYQAHHLITHGQIWVCEVIPSPHASRGGLSNGPYDSISGPAGRIVSICAVTRETEQVAAITKVFTHPNERRHGYAQYLLRHVMRAYSQRGTPTLVLYVGNELLGARRVYERVGFQAMHSPLPNDWVEVGFQDAQLGYW